MKTDEDYLMTCRQVQLVLRLGHTKVSNLIAAGQLASLKIGRARRVRRSALDRFIEAVSKANDEHEITATNADASS